MSTRSPLPGIISLMLLLVSCHQYGSRSYEKQSASTENLFATVSTADSARLPQQQQDFNTEEYASLVENDFQAARENPLSTFSIDVDPASYSNVRRYIREGALPPKGAVRIEEMINYFDYDYTPPSGDAPFAVTSEMGTCPWNTQHRLVHIGIKGKEIPPQNLPPVNLVFLVDVSGSMAEPNKLPLVKTSLKMLTDQLREQDRVAIVVYAGAAGLVLPSTSGSHKAKIKAAIDALDAGGSTAGSQGIQLAYEIARKNYIAAGNNRVILATDGDFNVGPSSDDELVSLIEQERQHTIFLTVLGFGMGNYKDSKMQQLADKGNGNHAYIDNAEEARKVLVKEFGGTLFTIAKDVKIQVEFNPAKVQAYRLIGYENRLLQHADFNDDKKDAGELGAGHRVTALYEIIPAGVQDEFSRKTDALKYQTNPLLAGNDFADEVMTVKLRYKAPKGEESRLIVHTVKDESKALTETSDNFRFSSAVAGFGMLLRNSVYKQNNSYNAVIALAQSAKGTDAEGYRSEFISLVKAASEMPVAAK